MSDVAFLSTSDKENVRVNAMASTPGTPGHARVRGPGKKVAETPATTLPTASPWTLTPTRKTGFGFEVLDWSVREHNTFVRVTPMQESPLPSTPRGRLSRTECRLCMSEPRNLKPAPEFEAYTGGDLEGIDENAVRSLWGPTPESSPMPPAGMAPEVPRPISLSQALERGPLPDLPAFFEPFSTVALPAPMPMTMLSQTIPELQEYLPSQPLPQVEVRHISLFDHLPSDSVVVAAASQGESVEAGGEESVETGLAAPAVGRRRTRRSLRSSARRRAAASRRRAAEVAALQDGQKSSPDSLEEMPAPTAQDWDDDDDDDWEHGQGIQPQRLTFEHA